MRRALFVIATMAAALAAPALASAHVTLQPEEAAAGSYTVLDVRVPNETEDANTTKVDVQFPPGFAEASYQPVPGWSVRVIKEKLAEPVQTDDGPVTEGVKEMIWTGKGSEGEIAPGQFMDFPVSVQIPGEAGEALTFKALQTYDNGEIVRWIGAPSSEHPAPQVQVTGEEESSHHDAAAATDEESDSGSDNGLAIVALAVGALGLIAGAAALVGQRRRGAAS
ncbi:MAG TPA: YcnI family protein [Solirubrobacterales bacterium]|nr:YcnI family protein [Solirubrobacterales bacterium]